MNAVLASLTFLSLILTFWRWVAARRFPLHARRPRLPAEPAVTILKPLKGCDPETRRCLQSWFEQAYSGPVQILFGVNSAEDAVCAVVNDLIGKYPQVQARLILCCESIGTNAKVSTLIQLQPHIAHEYVVISDADVYAPEDLLGNLMPMLEHPDTGLANCFYRLANPSTLAMRWESIAVNSDFWSQVLQAQSLKEIDFALGAVMALPRSQLEKIGGFASLASYLADDYQLGNQIARAGGRIRFCPLVVSCYESVGSWRSVWVHQLRWARTIRICQPLPFFFSILNNASLWPSLWLGCLVSGGAGLSWGAGFVLFSLVFRVATALDMQKRLTGSKAHLAYWWLIPMHDLLSTLTWALAFWGNQIQWRSERYRILRGGKLARVSEPG